MLKWQSRAQEKQAQDVVAGRCHMQHLSMDTLVQLLPPHGDPAVLEHLCEEPIPDATAHRRQDHDILGSATQPVVPPML